MRRGTRHRLVFAVFFALLIVGVVNVLFATHWLLPDYFFSEWDPYDHLFTVSSSADARETAAAPVLGDYIDDVRYQYSARTVVGAFSQNQDDVVRTWRRWLRGPWRPTVMTSEGAQAVPSAPTTMTDLSDVPFCPWPIKKDKEDGTEPVRFFTPMSSPHQFAAEHGAHFWHNRDSLAQLQLRYTPDLEEMSQASAQLAMFEAVRESGRHPALLRGQDTPAPPHCSDNVADTVASTEAVSDGSSDNDRAEEEQDALTFGEPRWVPPPSLSSSPATSTTTTSAALDYAALVKTVDVNKTWSRKVRYFDLPRQPAVAPPQHPWTHFYVALNLYHNEKMLPFLTAALVAWLEDEVAPFFDLARSVVVTIYANKANSRDQTGTLIRTLLIPELHRVGVRVVFATSTGACLGMSNKTRGVERIEWMACVRNKAMAPLYTHGMHLFSGTFAPEEDADAADERGRRSHHGESGQSSDEGSQESSSLPPSADGLVVLFLNDIYFRPSDLTRLLESRVEEGMRSVHVVSDGIVRAASTPPAGAAGVDDRASSSSSRSVLWPGFDMACGMDFYMNFYDTWVTRDRLGHTLRAAMPYTNDGPTQDAFLRIFDRLGTAAEATDARRQAVPVKCCWNGAAAIRGSFFLPEEKEEEEEEEEEESGRDARMKREDGKAHQGWLSDAPSADQSAAHAWLAAYFLRLQLRRLSTDRVKWAEACAKAASKSVAPVAPLDMSVRQFFEDDVPTLLAATDQCACDMASSGSDTTANAATSTNTNNAAMAFCTREKIVRATSDDVFVPRGVLSHAHSPAVRFRHALVPSYGAMHSAYAHHPARHSSSSSSSSSYAGLSLPAPVVDKVCLSSECQLICHDVQHAAMLRHDRLPIILMNPTVRVVYDAEDFNRVVLSGWYESSAVYRLLRFIARADRQLGQGLPHPWQPGPPRWWRLLRPWTRWALFASPSAEDKPSMTMAERQYSPKVHMRAVMDASDDWLRPAADGTPAHAELRQLTLPVETLGPSSLLLEAHKVVAVVVNITQLTRMDCLDDVLTDTFDPPLLLHTVVRLVALLITALLVCLCIRWANADARERTTATVLVPTPRAGPQNADAQWWLQGQRLVSGVRLCLTRRCRACGLWVRRRKVSAASAMGDSDAGIGMVAVKVQSPTTVSERAPDGRRSYPSSPSSAVVSRFAGNNARDAGSATQTPSPFWELQARYRR